METVLIVNDAQAIGRSISPQYSGHSTDYTHGDEPDSHMHLDIVHGV